MADKLKTTLELGADVSDAKTDITQFLAELAKGRVLELDVSDALAQLEKVLQKADKVSRKINNALRGPAGALTQRNSLLTAYDANINAYIDQVVSKSLNNPKVIGQFKQQYAKDLGKDVSKITKAEMAQITQFVKRELEAKFREALTPAHTWAGKRKQLKAEDDLLALYSGTSAAGKRLPYGAGGAAQLEAIQRLRSQLIETIEEVTTLNFLMTDLGRVTERGVSKATAAFHELDRAVEGSTKRTTSKMLAQTRDLSAAMKQYVLAVQNAQRQAQQGGFVDVAGLRQQRDALYGQAQALEASRQGNIVMIGGKPHKMTAKQAEAFTRSIETAERLYASSETVYGGIASSMEQKQFENRRRRRQTRTWERAQVTDAAFSDAASSFERRSTGSLNLRSLAGFLGHLKREENRLAAEYARATASGDSKEAQSVQQALQTVRSRMQAHREQYENLKFRAAKVGTYGDSGLAGYAAGKVNPIARELAIWMGGMKEQGVKIRSTHTLGGLAGDDAIRNLELERSALGKTISRAQRRLNSGKLSGQETEELQKELAVARKFHRDMEAEIAAHYAREDKIIQTALNRQERLERQSAAERLRTRKLARQQEALDAVSKLTPDAVRNMSWYEVRRAQTAVGIAKRAYWQGTEGVPHINELQRLGTLLQQQEHQTKAPGWAQQLMFNMTGRWVGGPPGGGPPGRVGGGGFHNYGRANDALFNWMNKRTTNVSQMMGLSLYGMGTIGLGTAMVRGSVGAAAEKESLVNTLGGMLSTYAQFVDKTDQATYAQRNFTKALEYAGTVYTKVREKAVKSILTTKEMFDYFMSGAPQLMAKGLDSDRALGVVDAVASIGKAMGLSATAVQSDIRDLGMGKIDVRSQVLRAMGFDRGKLRAAREAGPDALNAYFEQVIETFRPALTRLQDLSQSKLSRVGDAGQQLMIKVGEGIAPGFLDALMGLEDVMNEWITSGRAEEFGRSMGRMVEGLTNAFVGFTEVFGPLISNIENLLLVGFAGLLTRFAYQVIMTNDSLRQAMSSYGAGIGPGAAFGRARATQVRMDGTTGGMVPMAVNPMVAVGATIVTAAAAVWSGHIAKMASELSAKLSSTINAASGKSTDEVTRKRTNKQTLDAARAAFGSRDPLTALHATLLEPNEIHQLRAIRDSAQAVGGLGGGIGMKGEEADRILAAFTPDKWRDTETARQAMTETIMRMFRPDSQETASLTPTQLFRKYAPRITAEGRFQEFRGLYTGSLEQLLSGQPISWGKMEDDIVRQVEMLGKMLTLQREMLDTLVKRIEANIKVIPDTQRAGGTYAKAVLLNQQFAGQVQGVQTAFSQEEALLRQKIANKEADPEDLLIAQQKARQQMETLSFAYQEQIRALREAIMVQETESRLRQLNIRFMEEQLALENRRREVDLMPRATQGQRDAYISARIALGADESRLAMLSLTKDRTEASLQAQAVKRAADPFEKVLQFFGDLKQTGFPPVRLDAESTKMLEEVGNDFVKAFLTMADKTANTQEHMAANITAFDSGVKTFGESVSLFVKALGTFGGQTVAPGAEFFSPADVNKFSGQNIRPRIEMLEAELGVVGKNSPRGKQILKELTSLRGFNTKSQHNLSPEFRSAVTGVASRLGINVNDLLHVMQKESGIDPASVNTHPDSGATGLIQFMPSTAKWLGTSTQALRGMSAVQQLPFVEKYLKRMGVKPGADLLDVYLAVRRPSMMGKPWDYAEEFKGSVAYHANKGQDVNKDGKISVADIYTWLTGQQPEGVRGLELKARLGDKVAPMGILPQADQAALRRIQEEQALKEIEARERQAAIWNQLYRDVLDTYSGELDRFGSYSSNSMALMLQASNVRPGEQEYARMRYGLQHRLLDFDAGMGAYAGGGAPGYQARADADLREAAKYRIMAETADPMLTPGLRAAYSVLADDYRKRAENTLLAGAAERYTIEDDINKLEFRRLQIQEKMNVELQQFTMYVQMVSDANVRRAMASPRDRGAVEAEIRADLANMDSRTLMMRADQRFKDETEAAMDMMLVDPLTGMIALGAAYNNRQRAQGPIDRARITSEQERLVADKTRESQKFLADMALRAGQQLQRLAEVDFTKMLELAAAPNFERYLYPSSIYREQFERRRENIDTSVERDFDNIQQRMYADALGAGTLEERAERLKKLQDWITFERPLLETQARTARLKGLTQEAFNAARSLQNGMGMDSLMRSGQNFLSGFPTSVYGWASGNSSMGAALSDMFRPNVEFAQGRMSQYASLLMMSGRNFSQQQLAQMMKDPFLSRYVNMSADGSTPVLLPGGGMARIPHLKFGFNKGRAFNTSLGWLGAGVVSDLGGNMLGNALFGDKDPASISLGTQLGSAVGSSFGPLGMIAGGLLGGLVGGLFGGSKPDPDEERRNEIMRRHQERIEELLSRIDKNLRPQADYFKQIRNDLLYGTASRWMSGRAYASIGLQSAVGGR